MAAGANAILITPNDSKAIVPAIRKARNRGVLVIALDSPTDPTDAVDALFVPTTTRPAYSLVSTPRWPWVVEHREL
jgi:fructose transport system substrate-binding protein